MTMSIKKAAYFLRSEYGMEYNEQGVTGADVAKWVEKGLIKVKRDKNHITIERAALEDFVENSRWEGTAYEKEIDDQTKIERLLVEVMKLRKENERLQKENTEYALRLGIGDF